MATRICRSSRRSAEAHPPIAHASVKAIARTMQNTPTAEWPDLMKPAAALAFSVSLRRRSLHGVMEKVLLVMLSSCQAKVGLEPEPTSPKFTHACACANVTSAAGKSILNVSPDALSVIRAGM